MIGHNGAGKTTLLKLLAESPVRRAARSHEGPSRFLLEVGSGFHPS